MIFLNPHIKTEQPESKTKKPQTIITTKSRLQSVPLNPKAQEGGTEQQTATDLLVIGKVQEETVGNNAAADGSKNRRNPKRTNKGPI